MLFTINHHYILIMFGTRFVPLVTRAFSYSIRVTTIPKFEYSLVNKYINLHLDSQPVF